MRYKQKRRSNVSNIDKIVIKEKINGKILSESEGNEEVENDKIVNKVEDRITIEDSSVDSIDDKIDDQNENMDKNVEKNPKSEKFLAEDLIGKIAENDTYFSSLIDLIPAKIYFEGNEEILESMERQKRDLFGDDLDLSKKSKQKRFKLDPNSGKKISEIANNFYNKSNKKSNSKQNQSIDNKMEELKKKLNEKILRLKSKRGQKNKNQRESKKQRKTLNSMRAHKQKGFSKRQYLETNDNNSESKPKVRSEDKTDSKEDIKTAKNLPKIYNNEGNIVYSKFDLISSVPSLADKKKNGKKNKLQKLFVKTKKEEQKLSELEVKNPPKAQEIKEKKLWRKAIDSSEGIKVKDNSKLIKKSLIKKRQGKLKSKKNWEERKESLQKSMDAVRDKRTKNIKERQQHKKDKKIKSLKKRGRLLNVK